jgi:hypothetical protein
LVLFGSSPPAGPTEKAPKNSQKGFKTVPNQPCVKSVGLPHTQPEGRFFSGYRKAVFPSIFIRWAAFCPLGIFFAAYLEAPQRAEKLSFFFLWALVRGIK